MESAFWERGSGLRVGMSLACTPRASRHLDLSRPGALKLTSIELLRTTRGMAQQHLPEEAPNFSDFGRIRIDVTSGIRYEIFKDFYWGMTPIEPGTCSGYTHIANIVIALPE